MLTELCLAETNGNVTGGVLDQDWLVGLAEHVLVLQGQAFVVVHKFPIVPQKAVPIWFGRHERHAGEGDVLERGRALELRNLAESHVSRISGDWEY